MEFYSTRTGKIKDVLIENQEWFLHENYYNNAYGYPLFE